MVLADVTFGQVLLAVLEVFIFAAWLIVLFTILADLFRDHSISGWWKAVWVLFLIFIPFLTALIYLIFRGSGMRERSIKHQQEVQKEVNAYIRQQAGDGSAADELTKLSELHDKGKLSDAEFEKAKAKIVG